MTLWVQVKKCSASKNWLTAGNVSVLLHTRPAGDLAKPPWIALPGQRNDLLNLFLRDPPLWAKRLISSALCACMCVCTLSISLSWVSLSSHLALQESAWFCGLVRSWDAPCPSPCPFPTHPFDLKIPGKLFGRITSFPWAVVLTPKTQSLYFTKQVLLSVRGKILIKIEFFGVISLLSFTDLNPS